MHRAENNLKKKILKKSFYIARNRIKFYESLFPWITEYIGEDMDLLIKHISEDSKKEIELDYIWHNTKCSEILNRVSKGTATHDDAVFLADSLGINCFKQEK